MTGGDYVYQTTTAYGERLRFPLENGVPPPARAGTITIQTARLVPEKDPQAKQVFYYFEYVDSSGVAPKSVTVEDVTDEKPLPIIDDQEPKIVYGHWLDRTPPLDAASPLLGWVRYLDSSVRIYRFTIVKADGEKVILNQAWSVPAWFKAGMRKTLGME